MPDSCMAPLLRPLCVASLATVSAAVVYALPLTALEGSPDALLNAWSESRQSQEASSAFDEPLRLASTQSSGDSSGTLYGVVDAPFASLERALSQAGAWCAVLILDPNVHRCTSRQDRIDVEFGESKAPVAFAFERTAGRGDYLQVRLTAASGPFGTRDYMIAFEAAPLDAGRSIVHLTFAQRFGVAARIAMAAYFNTVGRSKVGFTVVDRDDAGRPVYVRDLRGALERNLMRYYFGILAYLDSLSAPPDQQPDRRVRTWLALTERYPLQLREDAGYLERKSPDVRSQHSADLNF